MKIFTIFLCNENVHTTEISFNNIVLLLRNLFSRIYLFILNDIIKIQTINLDAIKNIVFIVLRQYKLHITLKIVLKQNILKCSFLIMNNIVVYKINFTRVTMTLALEYLLEILSKRHRFYKYRLILQNSLVFAF